jgi:pyridoxal phosphate-dependent aminotransferase EpsN
MTTTPTKRIFLSPPHLSGREQKYIAEAFQTNWVAPLGPNVDCFEKEVAKYINVAGAVALNSGTAAIHLALKLLEVETHDEVFCSSLTFVASANPIVYQGAVPVFIDSEPESWNMSPLALEQALVVRAKQGRKPKAVIAVNLYGQSADYGRICQLCQTYGVPLIEDAAESLGATYGGKKSGAWGKYGIFSFNGNKIITTSGGGMLVSDDLEALEKARFWATQARDQARHYQHSEIGYNYRLSNVLAGIGRGQMEDLDDHVQACRAIFQQYAEQLATIPGVEFMPEIPDGVSTRWLTVCIIQPEITGVTALEIIEALEAANIEARPVWKPLHMQPVFSQCAYFPHQPQRSICEDIFSTGICLPSGSGMTADEQAKIIEIVQQCLNQ